MPPSRMVALLERPPAPLVPVPTRWKLMSATSAQDWKASSEMLICAAFSVANWPSAPMPPAGADARKAKLTLVAWPRSSDQLEPVRVI